MNRRSLRRTSSVLAGLGLAVLGVSNAGAVPVATQLLANGQDSGPQEEYGGPGNEQSTVDWVQVDGKTYVVSIYMSSKVSEEDGPWQCKCSSMVLTADGSPEVVADQVQLTDNDGDRPCNHPKAASDGSTVYWVYGSDNNSANTRTYVTAVDHMCNTVMDPQRISLDDNNNEGAPDIAVNGAGTITAGYLSTGENDRSIAVGLKTIDLGGGQVDVEQTYHTTVVTPSNIGRPTIVAQDEGYSLFCAAKGNNRPPEDGVQCARLDANTGDIMYKQILAASQPAEKIYMNQPTIVRLDNGYYGLHVLESSGEGKTDNKKGSNISHDYVITPGNESFTINAHEVALGNYPTHSTICSGAYGVEGKRHFGSFGSAITGNSAPLVQFFGYDNAIKADPSHNTWVAGWYADSGKLANLYGANPNTQGRDFLRCIGDVPNPGFGQPNGFLPSVKTFFVVPHAGRIPGEQKNSQWLSLIPGHTSVPVDVDPPADVKDIGLGPQGEEPTESEPPGPGSEPSDPSTKDEPSVLQPTGSNGCQSGGRDSGNGLALAALGLGLAMVSRRRKGA
jgi:uncharacterized protein (TIGR03382 family)